MMNNVDDDMRGIANGSANFCANLFGGIADVINRHNQIKLAKIDYFVQINNSNLDFVNKFFARDGLVICRKWKTYPWMVSCLIRAINAIDDTVFPGKEPTDPDEKEEWEARQHRGDCVLSSADVYFEGHDTVDYEELCVELTKSINYEDIGELQRAINEGVEYHSKMMGYYKKIHAQQDGDKLLSFFKLIEDDLNTRISDSKNYEPYLNILIEIIRHSVNVRYQLNDAASDSLKNDPFFDEVADALRSDDDEPVGVTLLNVYAKYFPDAAENYGWHV